MKRITVHAHMKKRKNERETYCTKKKKKEREEKRREGRRTEKRGDTTDQGRREARLNGPGIELDKNRG